MMKRRREKNDGDAEEGMVNQALCRKSGRASHTQPLFCNANSTETADVENQKKKCGLGNL